MSNTLHDAVNRWLKTIVLSISILHSAGLHTEAAVPAIASVIQVHANQSADSKS
ncbi:hypothetical protein [Paraburkholderia sp. BL21I4N1]|uniref:hypothetical protein n=1 Tax=Paraburkholderia sp. BL21I4N1 TaxID=1938801 RepID=UPI000D4CD0FA|nr:hypothetical protein [Paraburkholderia sp. BL21I4N1]PQV42734.1 hypothetical protein B0G83_1471 [Paraburkholderia sp. BL21I4N1]